MLLIFSRSVETPFCISKWQTERNSRDQDGPQQRTAPARLWQRCIATIWITIMKCTMLTVVALLSFCAAASAQQLEKAVFAGGCFWCVESDFDKVPGVAATISGYTGGRTENPTYEQVTAGGTGHYEAVEITYDPAKVSYEALLTAFWHSVDPTDDGGQFCDRGHSYKTAVFAANDKQHGTAEASRNEAQKTLGKPIVSPILAAGPFYVAEDYHQNYYEKNPVRYSYYRWRCERDKTVKDVWGARAYEGIPDHG